MNESVHVKRKLKLIFSKTCKNFKTPVSFEKCHFISEILESQIQHEINKKAIHRVNRIHRGLYIPSNRYYLCHKEKVQRQNSQILQDDILILP